MPSESAHYWRHLVFDDRRIGSPGTVWNQSLRGALARLAGAPDGAHLVWLALAAAVLVAGPGPGGPPATAPASRLLGLGVAAVTGLLVSPISWNHHWVWALPLAVGLVAGPRGPDGGPTGGSRPAGSPPSAWRPSRGGPSPDGDDYRLGAVDGVAADCYVLAALAVAVRGA